MFRRLAYIFVPLATWVLVPRIGFAAESSGETSGDQISIPNPLGEENLICIAENILSALFWVAVPVTSIMVLIGGFQILTAGGEPEKFKKGRNTIMYAAIGFFIVFIANGVVFIIVDIVGGDLSSGSGAGC